MYIVLGGYLLHNLYLSVADIANAELFMCVCRTWICLDIFRFHEEQYHPADSHDWLAQKR